MLLNVVFDEAMKKATAEILTSSRRSLFIYGPSTFKSSTEIERCAKKLNIDMSLLNKALDIARIAGKAEVDTRIIDHPKSQYTVRALTGHGDSRVPYATFDMALAVADESQVIEWDSVYWTCVLDLDFHNGFTPLRSELETACLTLDPQPYCWWLSKSGAGIHAVYQTYDMFTAEELAAVAGLSLQRRFPGCTVELLSKTRGPREKPDKLSTFPNMEPLKYLLNESVDDGKAWLERMGYEIGQSLEHTKCPVNPSQRGQSSAPPVRMLDQGVFCFICAADGIHHGSRKAGFFPYAKLNGNYIPSQIARCVRYMTHYGHARYIFDALIGNLAKPIYSALLKLQHGDDPRIPSVFTANEPIGLVRYQGYWANHRHEPLKVDRSSPMLEALPTSMVVDDLGKVTKSRIKCDTLAQTGNLAEIGYPALRPIFGFLFHRFLELPENRIYSVLPSPLLSSESSLSRRPRYITEARRISIDEAFARLEAIFPELNRNLILALIIARGVVEKPSSMHPMIFLTGPTGSGKTGHVQLAAAICGDSDTTPELKADEDRFMNSVITSKRTGGFMFFDEYFKNAKKIKITPIDAATRLLSFRPETLVYMIHIGAIPLGDLPVIIFADTQIPDEVQYHEQIGRRVHHVRLHSSLSWETTMRAGGLTNPKYIRSEGSRELIDACDAIISHIVDMYFSTETPDFPTVMSSLGFMKLNQSEAVEDRHYAVREFYQAVCMAPAMSDATLLKRWPGPGYKEMRAGDELDKLSEIIGDISEIDLRKVLGKQNLIRFEHRRHGLKSAVRFVQLESTNVNGDIT